MKVLDESTFEFIYRTYWQRLFEYARRKVHHNEAAEEIIQELFVKLWEQRERLQILNLENYLYTCVKNLVIDYYKQRLFSELESIDKEVGPDYPLFLDELETQILQAANRLPQKTRQIFMMNRLEGKSASEVSAELNLPQRTVEYHITIALRKLKYDLKDYTLLLTIGGICEILNRI